MHANDMQTLFIGQEYPAGSYVAICQDMFNTMGLYEIGDNVHRTGIYNPHFSAANFEPWFDPVDHRFTTYHSLLASEHLQRCVRAEQFVAARTQARRNASRSLYQRMIKGMQRDPKRYVAFSQGTQGLVPTAPHHFTPSAKTMRKNTGNFVRGVLMAVKTMRKAAEAAGDTLTREQEFMHVLKLRHDHFVNPEANAPRLDGAALFAGLNAITGGALAQFDRNESKIRDKEWREPTQAWRNFLLQHSDVTALHQVHVSTSNPSLLAYTQSVDKLIKDVQTTIRPGRYLAKYFPDMSQDEIKHLAESWSEGVGELKFVENTDPEGWISVYSRGPNSCMRGEDCVQVYARPGNGLRLAYLERDGDIVARAIVREDDSLDEPKQYIRVYPNCDTTELSDTHTAFRTLLQSNGYVHGNLNGVKLQAIEHDNGGYVMPYIDYGNNGGQYVTLRCDVHGEYFVVGRDGSWCAENTNGQIGYDEHTCDHCGDACAEDDLTWVEREETSVCQTCLDRHYVEVIGRRGNTYYLRDRDAIYCESDGEYYDEEYASSDHDIYQCAHTGDWYHIDDLISCEVGKYEGELICCDLAERDEITDEVAHVSEFESDEAGVNTFTEYLRRDHVTGDSYHIETMVLISVGKVKIHVHPDNLTAENLYDFFVKCGNKLYPQGYYGHEITCRTEPFEPVNVTYPDHGNYDEIVDVLTDNYVEPDDTETHVVQHQPIHQRYDLTIAA